MAPLFHHKWGPRWVLDARRGSLDALWVTSSARSQSLQQGLWPGLLVPLAFDAPVLKAFPVLICYLPAVAASCQ